MSPTARIPKRFLLTLRGGFTNPRHALHYRSVDGVTFCNRPIPRGRKSQFVLITSVPRERLCKACFRRSNDHEILAAIEAELRMEETRPKAPFPLDTSGWLPVRPTSP